VLNLQTAGTTAIAISASQAVTFTNSPTVTGGTANGVAYLNGSKVLTTGSALVFDGTNLGVGVTPSAWSQGKAIEVLEKGYGFWNGTSSSYILANAYYNGGFKYGGTGQASYYYQYQGAHVWSTAASGTAGNAITFTQAMTLDASGNLSVGGTSANLLSWNKAITLNTVSGNAAYEVSIGGVAQAYFAADATNVYLAAYANKPLLVRTNNATVAAFDTSGNLLVGQTATSNPPTSTKDIYAGGLWLNPSNRTAANSASAYWEASSGVFYRSTSSLRYKTNVVSYTKGLQDVMNLRAVSFNPKDGDKKDRVYAGFIAEEIDTLGLKEFVEYDAEGLPDSVAYAQITALLLDN
jgi:hypothetical protein